MGRALHSVSAMVPSLSSRAQGIGSDFLILLTFLKSVRCSELGSRSLNFHWSLCAFWLFWNVSGVQNLAVEALSFTVVFAHIQKPENGRLGVWSVHLWSELAKKLSEAGRFLHHSLYIISFLQLYSASSDWLLRPKLTSMSSELCSDPASFISSVAAAHKKRPISCRYLLWNWEGTQ